MPHIVATRRMRQAEMLDPPGRDRSSGAALDEMDDDVRATRQMRVVLAEL